MAENSSVTKPRLSKLERLQQEIAKAEAAAVVKQQRAFVKLVATSEVKREALVKAEAAYQTAFTAAEKARAELDLLPGDEETTSVDLAARIAATLPPEPERKPRKKAEPKAPAKVKEPANAG